MSLKNGSVAELHHFKSMSGAISSEGKAQVTLELDSVETLIPIRNQRLRELLFETAQFPAATISADVPETVDALEVGQSAQLRAEVSVQLHGKEMPYKAVLQITRLEGNGLLVALREPLLVKAADFGLEGGIQTLRKLAGLNSISTNVPVSAQLVFVSDNK